MKCHIICLLFLISPLILFCGCINDSSNTNIPYGNNENLNFEIQSDQEQYSLSSLNKIIIHFVIENIGKDKIRIEKRFDLGANLELSLYDSENNSIDIKFESSTHIIEEIILNPGDSKEYQINIINEIIQYPNGTKYCWVRDQFYADAKYFSLSNEVINSNRISFEII